MRNYHGVTVVPIIVDKTTNKIKRTLDTQHNLILDVGLNRLASTTISQCLARCAIGTGTLATNRGTQGIFVNKTGSTVTTTGSFFTNDDALFKRVLQLSDETVCRILTVDSATQATVSDDVSTLTNGAAIIWNTEQTTLETQLMVSATVNTSKATYNGTVITTPELSGVKTINIDRFRTFQFDFEDESHTITEAGWTWDEVAGTPQLFGRVVFSNPVVITPHDRLLIKVIFNHKFPIPDYVANDPYFAANGTWDATPVVSNRLGISSVNSNGTLNDVDTSDNDFLSMLEPCEAKIIMAFVNSDNTDLKQLTVNANSYIANSYQRTWPAVAVSDDFATSIKSLRFRFLSDPTNPESATNGLTMTYTAAQAKADQTVITTAFSTGWDRKLPAFPQG